MSATKLYKHLPNDPEEADNWLEEFKTQADIAANRLGQIQRDTDAAVIHHQETVKDLATEEQTLIKSVSDLKIKESALLKSIGTKTTELATLENEASERMVAMQKREADVSAREHAVGIQERRVQISSQRLAQ